jgi:sugar lactone lactonase YvrE
MSRELEVLVDGGTFFEGLRWHEGRWYVSDFYADRVLAVAPDGTSEVAFEVPVPSGLGWLPDGSLLAVSMAEHALFRRGDDGEAVLHASLAEWSRGAANDMVVDAQGRAYVGNYGYDLAAGESPRGATLVRVDPDGTATPVADGLHFPNGSLITPDGGTLIVAETIAARFSAFTVAADGSLTDRRVWGQVAPAPALEEIDERYTQVGFAPDGCTLDAEGCVWAGDSLHRRFARIAPGGEILEEVPSPDGLVVYGAMLGGDDGRTLALAAAPDWREERPEGETVSAVYTTTVDVPHAGRP